MYVCIYYIDTYTSLSLYLNNDRYKLYHAQDLAEVGREGKKKGKTAMVVRKILTILYHDDFSKCLIPISPFINQSTGFYNVCTQISSLQSLRAMYIFLNIRRMKISHNI